MNMIKDSVMIITCAALVLSHRPVAAIDPPVDDCYRCHSPEGPGRNLKSIRDSIEWPPDSGQFHTVKFTKFESDISKDGTFDDGTLADGNDEALDGPCEVCHSQTLFHRNTQNPRVHYDGKNCMRCHAHPANTHFPVKGGRHSASHQVHIGGTRGPQLQNEGVPCLTCHGSKGFDSEHWADGASTLAETKVCFPCHSPGGPYDGVNDPIIGAKANWTKQEKSLVYDESGRFLKAEKRMWCTGCHDAVSEPPAGGDQAMLADQWASRPSNSKADGTGVNAPKVGGDGLVWGYWVSGHGRSSDKYPAGVSCEECHDLTKPHIDHKARTFTVDESIDPPKAQVLHRDAYRLIDDYRLDVPRATTDAEAVVTEFRFCTRCHDGVFKDNLTNFRNEKRGGKNLHLRHAEFLYPMTYWDSDYDGVTSPKTGNSGDSQISCLTCHNVHGSRFAASADKFLGNPVMIQDGALTDSSPGLCFQWVAQPQADGGGVQCTQKSVSRGGRLNTRKPFCADACHDNSPSYERDPKNTRGISSSVLRITDTKGRPKTKFFPGETLRVHVGFRIVGFESGYSIGSSDKWSKVMQRGGWSVPLTPGRRDILEPGTYSDKWSWDIEIPENKAASGTGIVRVVVELSDEARKTVLDRVDTSETFMIAQPRTSRATTGLRKQISSGAGDEASVVGTH